jgi:hypothetical protein
MRDLRECSYSCFASIPGESDGCSGEQDNPTEALFLSFFLFFSVTCKDLRCWSAGEERGRAPRLKALLRFCH